MNTQLRAHVGRRRAAIDRLGTLTSGVVVAGVAGTVGFGILAAATYRGSPSDDSVAKADDSSNDEVAPAPASTSAPALAAAPTPRAAKSHKSHAATGGSG